MNIKDFSADMKKAVKASLGKGYKIEEMPVHKNNGVILDALVIRKDGTSLSPTIYLKSYYENYMDGEDINDCAKRLVSNYLSAVPEEEPNMEFYADYENVKKGLSYKLISSERNKSLLKTVPHVPFLDLEIVFYYSLDISGMSDGTILIKDSHLEMWGIDSSTLINDARQNAPGLLPGKTGDMYSVLKNMKKDIELEELDQSQLPKMYIVSNSKMVNGAAAMLYPGLMKNLSEKLGGNLFIIPSSVHELIVLPDEGLEDIGYLKDMIYTVNRSQVDPQDVLSDSLYYFDSETEIISIA